MQSWRPSQSGSGIITEVSGCHLAGAICFECLTPDGFQMILVAEQAIRLEIGGLLKFNETYAYYKPPFAAEEYPFQVFIRVPWDSLFHPDMYAEP